MFSFIKNMFCHCESDKKDETLEKKQRAAHEQDKEVRESMTESQIDKGLKDTMEASDPVAKY